MLMFETINPGMLLNMVPSRAGQHIGQCIFSNHLYPPPRREHLSTSDMDGCWANNLFGKQQEILWVDRQNEWHTVCVFEVSDNTEL